ncbi:hypothetical protein ARSEF4850_009794 [Beauveria asiatica]
MDPVSAIRLIPVCYTTALKIIEICSTWKHAAREVGQRVLVVESCWDRTRLQVDFVSRIAKIMDDEQRLIMERLLSELAQSLSHALSSLESVVNKEAKAQPGIFGLGYRVKKASWVWKKDALDNIVSDLEAWQRRFDPSWFLLMKIADPVIDSELKKASVADSKLREAASTATDPLTLAAGLRTALTSAADRLKTLSLPDSPMDWLRIPFSDAKAARLSSASKADWYIVDSIKVNGSRPVGDVARDVRVLAAKLSEADPLTFSLLNCKGYVAVTQKCPRTTPSHSRPGRIHLAQVSESHRAEEHYSQFRLVFRTPRGMEVLQSLRHLLLNSDAHISLSRKMSIAREMAKAVNYVHTFAFVHKNVRPESILCFEDVGASRNHAFLIGFDAFRATDGGTMMGGDVAWDRNVYRHPSRQGTSPAERYSMQHDIYSLGVCLLEIGLWESFVEYSTASELDGALQTQFGKSYHDFQAWLRQRGGTAGPEVVAFKLKDYMIEQANTRLACRMGDKYAHLTVSCLACLDDDTENFLLSETDGDEQAVARQFIETVLKGLSDISV